jgi:hypothetical protein
MSAGRRHMVNSPTATTRRGRKGVKSIGRDFAMDVEWKMIEAATISYVDVVRSLRSLERHYLARLQDHPELALEIRHRIAENELEQALIHGCVLPVCRAKLQVALRLGFSNVERKAHFYLLYARGALAHGHKRVARRSSSEMVGELERSLKKQKSLLAEQCLTRTREFLNFINESSNSRVPHP